MSESVTPLGPQSGPTSTSGSPAPGSAPPADSCAMVIFGAGGDLTKRLVTPALYNLACTRLLPDNFVILGVDHVDGSDEDWRKRLTETMQSFVGGTGEFDPSKIDTDTWSWLTGRMFYLQGDFEKPETYNAIRDKLAGFEKSHNTGGNALFYLAVAGREGRHDPLAPCGDREAVRPRSGVRQGPQRPHPEEPA